MAIGCREAITAQREGNSTEYVDHFTEHVNVSSGSECADKDRPFFEIPAPPIFLLSEQLFNAQKLSLNGQWPSKFSFKIPCDDKKRMHVIFFFFFCKKCLIKNLQRDFMETLMKNSTKDFSLKRLFEIQICFFHLSWFHLYSNIQNVHKYSICIKILQQSAFQNMAQH